MSNYMEFTSTDGSKIFVEVEEKLSTDGGLIKAGASDKVKGAVNAAQVAFEAVIERVVVQNAQAFVNAVGKLSESPAEVEVTFALKAAGELGIFTIAKISGDANYTVKMVWKRQ